MPDNDYRDDLPQATVVVRKQRRVSVVWIIPIVAAVVAIGIAIQRIMSEGPTITIVFKAAQGIEAGKTFVKYKDVNIGQVTAVRLSPDYSRVEVTAKIDKSAAGLMVEDAQFWVVEPRVTLSGISGLGTLLSGNHIGFEIGKSDKKRTTFIGVDVPPIVGRDQEGRQFVLKAPDLGSLGIGSPIYYRRMQVGQVIGNSLHSDGKQFEIKVFVNDPYDKYITAETRFWNASGVDVSIGAGGMEVRTQSVVAMLAGGVAFEAPPNVVQSEPVARDTVFTLYVDRAAAMKAPEALGAHYVLYFNESLRGLSVGAPVMLLGLPAGEVTAVGLDINPVTLNVRGRAEIVTYPQRVAGRLELKQAAFSKTLMKNADQRHAFWQHLIEKRGLRAQLRSGSLITGQLFVALDYFADAPKAKIDWSRDPVEIPVAPSTVQDLEAKMSGILAKLDNLPYEAIGDDLKKALASLDQTVKDVGKAVNRLDADVTPGLKTTLDGLRGTMDSVDGMLKNTDATLVGKDAPAQQDLRDALQEISRAARSARVLTDYLERHPEALIRGKTAE